MSSKARLPIIVHKRPCNHQVAPRSSGVSHHPFLTGGRRENVRSFSKPFRNGIKFSTTWSPPKSLSERRTPRETTAAPHQYAQCRTHGHASSLRTKHGGHDGSLGVRRTGSDSPQKAARPREGRGVISSYFRIRTTKKSGFISRILVVSICFLCFRSTRRRSA